MVKPQIALLVQELAGLKLAAEYLSFSLERCQAFLDTSAQNSPEALERLESLTSRFARLADLLTQRLFRLIDDIELVGSSSLLDRIYRAEKRGWLDAAQMIEIRELRNLIAHEYANDKMPEIFSAVATLAPPLLAIVPKVTHHAQILIRKYPTK
jgi:hypothetical protein